MIHGYAIMRYGNEHFGRLETVLLHNPKDSLHRITKQNFKKYLFDELPNIKQFIKEHNQYRELLKIHGVEVLELSDYVSDKTLLNNSPNMAYVHDVAVVTSKGAFISKMAFSGRKNEDRIIKEAFERLGIPLCSERGKEEIFEGFLPYSKKLAILVETERYNVTGVHSFLKDALDVFDEILYVKVPPNRIFMHYDMIIGRLKKDLVLCYPDAILKTELITKNERFEVDFMDFFSDKNIGMIPVSQEEQKRWATSFVPLEPGLILNYDISLNKKTKKKLKDHDVEVISFSPKALLSGSGSLNCLTLQIYRT